ncbi:MAG: FliM/FliN family flagellar motor switch protein, partial [Mailhella sp.]|nr:FliM/FliN family flagellar motor switch protein [Mailhella sp.]
EDLPEDVRAAVLAALFEPALDALRALLKMPCSLRALHFDIPAASGDAATAFGLLLALPSAGALPAQNVFLRLAPASAGSALRLADALNTLPRQSGVLAEAAAQIPLDASLEVGFVRLGLADAASLAAGDVLIPDVWTATEGRLTLRIEQGEAPLCAPCTINAGRAVLDAPLAPLTEASEAGTDALTAPSAVDIRLGFELARATVEAGKLSELMPGHSLPLGADSSTVTVLARGKAIARGRVADMDGVIGILLTETVNSN